MKTNLRILLIEDSAVDATLISRQLQASGFSFRMSQVETESELRHELAQQKPDLVLSDHGLPAFSGFTALEIVRETDPELPFIFVSGSNSQPMILDMFDRGATDYVFKNDIGDLKLAVQNALGSRPEAVATPPPSPSPEPPAAIKPPAKEATVQVPKAIRELVRLQFCPKCLQLRDETGQTVWASDYFQSHVEVTVSNKLCDKCALVQPHA